MGSAIIAALAAIAGFAASYFTQVKLASEQIKREQVARAEQRVADFQKWQREQFVAALGNAVRAMNLYVSTWISGRMDQITAQDNEEMRRLAADMQAALNVIGVIISPNLGDSDAAAYKTFLDKACHDAVPQQKLIWDNRQTLIEHAANSQAIRMTA
jgi:hypothetical protein